MTHELRRPRPHALPGSVLLGRVAGIPIGLHYSWFVIAALITFSLASHFSGSHPGWGAGAVWFTSLVTAMLFFASLLAHELSHALVARWRHLPVRSITLFALGGLAQIEKRANTARTEFLVAVVGPLTSATIGLVCIAVATSLGWSPRDGASGFAGAILGWLGSINVILALFNLIPGYPLDGGRILRAILWGVYASEERATRQASRAGQVVAGMFIVFGLWQFLLGAGINGLWLAFIGWFLLSAAQAEYADLTVADTLAGLRVADLMAEECATVDAAANVHELVDGILLKTGRRCVVVQRDGRVVGLITPNEVRTVERERWVDVAVADVMRPLAALKTVRPETPATEAFRIMGQEDVNQLPVMSDGRLEGMITRGRILQLLQSRLELR